MLVRFRNSRKRLSRLYNYKTELNQNQHTWSICRRRCECSMLQASCNCGGVGLCGGTRSRAVSMYIGSPKNWQTKLQRGASPVMLHTTRLLRLTTILLIPIAIGIPIAITILCIRYNQNNLIKLKQVNKNTLLEIIWATIPAAILVCICTPSLKVLKHQLTQKKKPYTTVKIIAHQWYWNYEYNFKRNKFKYDSNMLRDDQRKTYYKSNLKSYPKLLAVDYELILPVARTIKLLITSADVIHAFAVPSLGIKIDAIPGKINETWIKVIRTGIYYGQCSEFCGKDHSYMPIAIRVIDENSFKVWTERATINLSDSFDVLRLDSEIYEYKLKSH
ncbi:Cytochrome c oxidase subunit 2 [Candidatus Hodgkinia cicadicola]|nr:Cytochrome c oxidase subunit 2 [Candidatus Hodgkinia cicadicola]